MNFLEMIDMILLSICIIEIFKAILFSNSELTDLLEGSLEYFFGFKVKYTKKKQQREQQTNLRARM